MGFRKLNNYCINAQRKTTQNECRQGDMDHAGKGSDFILLKRREGIICLVK